MNPSASSVPSPTGSCEGDVAQEFANRPKDVESADDEPEGGRPLPANLEIELKLSAEAPAFQALRSAPVVAARANGPAVTQRLDSTYYDTADLKLFRSGLALRVRQIGQTYVQTLKQGDGTAPGRLGRGEWEVPLPSAEPDPAAFESAEAEALLNDTPVAELRPVFSTRIERHRRILTDPGGDGRPPSRIEIAFDEGEVIAGEHSVPVREIELELLEGAPEALYRLGLELHDIAPLCYETRSKAARGYALGGGVAPDWQKAVRIALDQDVTVAGALAVILGNCLGHLTVNQAAALEGQDAEGVHQARVALRRMRSALSTFRDVIPAERLDWLRAETGWLAGGLGPARDWDVFLADLLAPVAAARPGDPALTVLQSAAGTARARGYDDVRTALRSPRTTRLVLTLAAWIEGEGWREGATADQTAMLDRPMRAYADELLERQHRKVLKRGRGFKRLAAPERHRVRIALKKLRYASEFCQSLYSRKASRSYHSALTDLQDTLGHLNDVSMAERLLTELIAEGEKRRLGLAAGALGQARLGAGTVIGWHTRSVADLEPKVLKDWHEFTDSDPFWKRPKR